MTKCETLKVEGKITYAKPTSQDGICVSLERNLLYAFTLSLFGDQFRVWESNTFS